MSESLRGKSNKRILVLANNDVGLYRFRKDLLPVMIHILHTGCQMHKSQLWDVTIELATKYGQLLMDTLEMVVSENSTKKMTSPACITGE